MHYLVTGAAGFIGAAVSRALISRGDSVIGIDNLNDYYDPQLKEDRLDAIRSEAGDKFRFRKVDFSNWDRLVGALSGEKFDAIVHLGAQAGVRYSLENPQAYVASNLAGHVNVLELARTRGVQHMVYASSSSVYGGNEKLPFSVDDRTDHPVSLYAATKRSDELMSEAYAHLYQIPLTGLRFFTVYGPWGRPDMMLWKFTKAIRANEPIQVFNHGDMYRDFTFIDNIVNGVLACLDAPPADDGQVKPGGSSKPHAIYNIGNNRSEHLMKVIGVLEDACGTKADVVMQPMQPGDVHKTYADISAMEDSFGYAPSTTIEQGVPAFVDWFDQYHARD